MAEFNLGTLRGVPKLKINSVGDSDTSDVFSFSLNKTSNINASLTDMKKDADIRIYQDFDNNGLLDKSIDIEIGSSDIAEDNQDESINLGSFDAGNYLAEVEGFPGKNTSYHLGLSATDPLGTSNASSQTRASNLLPAEFSFATLSNFPKTAFSEVGNSDTADTYRFNVSGRQALSVSLTGLSSDADVRLIQDFDGDRVIDANEVLQLGTNGGTASESFVRQDITGDNCYIQVYQFSGNTNYQLDVEAHPVAR